MKCRKITDTEARALCHALIRKKEAEIKNARKKEISVGEKTDILDVEDERIDWRLGQCLRIYDPKKRDLCFQKLRKEAAEKQKKEEAKAKAAEEQRQKELKRQRGLQKAPLTIKKCENLNNHRDRIVCYAEFHQERLSKQKEANATSLTQRKTGKKESAALYSPTLARIKCKKISDRNERNECLQDVYYDERERKEEQRAELMANFNLDEELRTCYEINNDNRREDCFDDLDKLVRQVFDEKDDEFQDWLNTNRR